MSFKSKGHLTWEEIVKIETLKDEGLNITEISIRLGRNKSVVSRCISNNSTDGDFIAEKAWQLMYERKRTANSHLRIVSDSVLEKFIIDCIEMHWSPEQIAGKWRVDADEIICHETIYKWLYAGHCDLIKLRLRRKGSKYRRKRSSPEFITNKRSIDMRPEEVEKREVIGHWEGDTMLGKTPNGPKVLINVERKSGLLLAAKVENKTADAILESTKDLFEKIPEELCLSITYDNGTEFARHKEIENSVEMKVYFAHAYSPWERGTCENTIGLLREFIPKGTDLRKISNEELQYYVGLINNRPRKRLGFRTPIEVFEAEIKERCICP
jgi:IS30 family transposase